ncbi:MAG: cytochrome c oxidase assembly protein [Pseudomonadota bacterium]
MDPANQTSAQSSAKSALKLLLVVFGMFGFGFALVPLYDVICDITGLNGKTGDQYVVTETLDVQDDRMVTIQFLTNNNDGMPWEFRPATRSLQVHPGDMNEVSFFARNPVDGAMVAQAIPSVTPGYAAKFLHKTECFCFEQQELASGESIDMPMRFIIDKELPADITRITLSYTLFDITDHSNDAPAAD